jgi:membrane protein DedA with SNARE-associated domain
MFEALMELFQGTVLSLWGPFFVLLACGLGLPMPEDIVLLTAGVLSRIDGRSWLQVSTVMYVGVLSGDTMTFLSGRYFGTRLLATRWMHRYLSPAKQERVEYYFERHGTAGLFIGRFLPGLRAPIFFSAGSMKVSFLKFICLDGLAALISVPFFVWLGHWLWDNFHADIEEFHKAMDRTQTYALLATLLMAVLLSAAALWLWRHRRHHAE